MDNEIQLLEWTDQLDEAMVRDRALQAMAATALAPAPLDRDPDALAIAEVCRYGRVAIAALLGDSTGAVRLLNEARQPPIVATAYYWYVHRDPSVVEPLRGYAPFEALLRPRE